jgi:hypothetical protein
MPTSCLLSPFGVSSGTAEIFLCSLVLWDCRIFPFDFLWAMLFCFCSLGSKFYSQLASFIWAYGLPSQGFAYFRVTDILVPWGFDTMLCSTRVVLLGFTGYDVITLSTDLKWLKIFFIFSVCTGIIGAVLSIVLPCATDNEVGTVTVPCASALGGFLVHGEKRAPQGFFFLRSSLRLLVLALGYSFRLSHCWALESLVEGHFSAQQVVWMPNDVSGHDGMHEDNLFGKTLKKLMTIYLAFSGGTDDIAGQHVQFIWPGFWVGVHFTGSFGFGVFPHTQLSGLSKSEVKGHEALVQLSDDEYSTSQLQTQEDRDNGKVKAIFFCKWSATFKQCADASICAFALGGFCCRFGGLLLARFLGISLSWIGPLLLDVGVILSPSSSVTRSDSIYTLYPKMSFHACSRVAVIVPELMDISHLVDMLFHESSSITLLMPFAVEDFGRMHTENPHGVCRVFRSPNICGVGRVEVPFRGNLLFLEHMILALYFGGGTAFRGGLYLPDIQETFTWWSQSGGVL